MSTISSLRTQLNGCKGTDQWKRIADHAGCHYFTVARIARGALENPGVLLVDRLFAAVVATSAPGQPAASCATIRSPCGLLAEPVGAADVP